jgi:site-specific DNA recombinase
MNYNNTAIKPDVNANLSELELIERERLVGNCHLPDLTAPYAPKAGIYLRVSSGPQAEQDKASLPEQEKRAREEIKKKGWDLVTVKTDVISTSNGDTIEKRSGINDIFDYAKQGKIDIVIVWIDSRIGRNFRESQKIRDILRSYCVQIYSLKRPLQITDPRIYNPQKDKSNQIYQSLNDVMSMSEMYEFSEKMSFGKHKKAFEGKIPSKIPYGYEKVKRLIKENGKQKLVVDTISVPEKLNVIKRMFDMYQNKGYGFRKIVETLNNEGVPSPGGGLWCYSTVRYQLKNPTYTGKVRWGWRLSQSQRSRARLMHGHTGVITQGEHPKALDEKDFIKIQKKITERAKMGGRAVSSKGLLTGILKCGRCGGNAYITSSPSAYAYQKAKEGKRKEDFSRCYYYVCSTVSKYGGKACKRYIGSQRKIEGYVVNQIKTLANSPEAQKSFQEEIRKTNTKHLKTKIKSLKNELRRLPEMKNRCSVAYREGIMNIEDYGKNLGELEQKENKTKTEIKQTEKEISESKITKDKIQKAIKAFRNFDLIWSEASFEKKRDLIRDIIREVKATSRKIEMVFNIIQSEKTS